MPEIPVRENVQELEREPRVKLHFVLVEHAPERAKEIAEALKDADVLAIEMISDSLEQREEIASIVNDLVRLPPDASESLPFFKELDGKIRNPLLKELIWHLRGSNKKFYFIDVIQSLEPELLKEGEDMMREHSTNLLLEPQAARNSLVNYIEAMSKANQTREGIVQRQIQDIIEREKAEVQEDISLYVLEGMIHTRPFHTFAKTEEDVSRSFSPRLPLLPLVHKDTSAVSYGYLLEAVRMRIFTPDRPLSDELLDRTLLEDYITWTVYLPSYFSNHERMYLTRKVIEDFSHDDVKKILEGIATFLQDYRILLEKDIGRPRSEEEIRHFGSLLRDELRGNLYEVMLNRFQIASFPESHIAYTLLLALLDERKRERAGRAPDHVG